MLVLEASRAPVDNGTPRKEDQEIAAAAPESRPQKTGLRVQAPEEVVVLKDIAEGLSEAQLIYCLDGLAWCYVDGLARIHVVRERCGCPEERCLATACVHGHARARFVEMFRG